MIRRRMEDDITDKVSHPHKKLDVLSLGDGHRPI